MQDNAGKRAEGNTVICERKRTGGKLESSCDFYLPDYMGDVKRIMASEAVAMSAGFNETDGGASFAVVVGYSVIYLDGDNKLTEAQFTSDLDFTVLCDENIVDATLELDTTGLQVRAAGARKLSARASVCAEVGLLVKCDMPKERLEGENEVILKEISVHSPRYLQSKELDLAEEIAFIEDISAEELEVIFERAQVTRCGVVNDDNGDFIEGELLGECLVMKNGESYERLSGIIRLNAPLPEEWEGKTPDFLKLEVSSASVSINNATKDEDMKVGASVVMSVVVDAVGRIDSNEKRTLIKDAFIPGALCECIEERVSYDELLFKRCVSEKISLDITADELSLDAIGELLYCSSRVRLCGIESEDGMLYAEGELLVNGIVSTDGRATQIKRAHPIKLPLKIEARDGVRINFNYTQRGCEYHPAQDSIGVVVAIEIYLCALMGHSESAVGEITRKPLDKTDDFGVCIYYPREGETLFSVAKKYGVSCESVAERNGIAMTVSNMQCDEVYLDISKPIILGKYLK